jgi:hypothetical protein
MKLSGIAGMPASRRLSTTREVLPVGLTNGLPVCSKTVNETLTTKLGGNQP